MNRIVHLCCTAEEDASLRPTAIAAVAWAILRLDLMEPRPEGTWVDASSPVLGYVQRTIDEDGDETIRLRPDSTSTDDDVVLVEAPLRGAPPFTGDADVAVLRSSLERWHDALMGCRIEGDRMPDDQVKDQRGIAAMIADVVDATAEGPGLSYVIAPPSIHSGTRIITVGTLGPKEIPDEDRLCLAADAALGHMAWLMPRRMSASVSWRYVDPSSHAFRLPSSGPDPIAALRAHAALEAAGRRQDIHHR